MGKVLVLRTCDADRKGYGGFQWPESGPVECPDWDPRPKCGNGLHGFLWGEGDGELANWDASALWLVVEVDESDVVQFDGKVKFPRGVVVYCGDRLGATTMIHAARPGAAIIGGTATAGDYGTATAGYRGTATAGEGGTATAGYRGTATAGDYGTATAGEGGTATAGEDGILNIRWWDGRRCRIAVFYVGEDGIEADVKYKCENGKAVKVVK